MTNDETKTAAIAADERRYQALFAEDFDKLGAMLVDDYVHTHANGKVDDKDTFINTLKGGAYRFVSAERTDQRARTYGNVVLLDGKVATTITMAGKQLTIRNAFVTVWNVQGGEWKMAHWQATKLPEA